MINIPNTDKRTACYAWLQLRGAQRSLALGPGKILRVLTSLEKCVAQFKIVLELCFLKLSLCTFGTNAAALIVSAGK